MRLSSNQLSIHATSNINIPIGATQVKGLPLAEFIKKEVKAPGTIITLNPKIIIIKESMPVRKIRVETVLYDKEKEVKNLLGFDLKLEYHNYLQEKEGVYFSIVNSLNEGGHLNIKNVNLLVSGLMTDN